LARKLNALFFTEFLASPWLTFPPTDHYGGGI
jgi:hypothetical protein